MKARIAVILILAMALFAYAYAEFDKIFVFALSKVYGISVSYTSLAKDRSAGYSLDNLKILNRRIGIGFFASRANLKLNKKTSLLKSLDIDFRFRDVHFITTRPEKALGVYDSLNKLVAVPFEGRWKYRNINGTAEIFSNGLTLKDMSANSSEIRMAMSGDMFYNNTMDMAITIFFSGGILKDIPPEIQSVMLKDEPDGWKSFCVKLTGDYHSPALNITGKLFRLNIGEAVVKE
jgi:hypothetical protein